MRSQNVFCDPHRVELGANCLIISTKSVSPAWRCRRVIVHICFERCLHLNHTQAQQDASAVPLYMFCRCRNTIVHVSCKLLAGSPLSRPPEAATMAMRITAGVVRPV
jgi:hypothetical protein